MTATRRTVPLARTVARAAIPVILTVLATGCASSPKRAAPPLHIDAPRAWSTDATGSPPQVTPAGDEAWWTRFGDVALDTLVAEALRANHDLRAATARVDAAAAQARIAGADAWPSLTATGTARRQQQAFIGLPVPGAGDGVLTTRSTTYGVSLDTSWELDLWGRVRAGTSAALADVEAAEADASMARLSIAGQTVKAYVGLTAARLQLELADASVESFGSTAERVRARYERGVRPALDVRLADADAASAVALRELRLATFDRTARQLETLLGRYPARTLAGGDSILRVDARQVPEVVPVELLSRRPDLVAAERRAAAAGARVSEAKRALLPRLTLAASAGRSSNDPGDLTDSAFDVWSLLGGLSAPLFQGGRLRAGASLAEAAEAQALESYAGAVLAAFADVESALALEQMLERREESLSTAAEHARSAERLARAQYDSGLIDIITVLTAQRRRLVAESELLDVRAARASTRVDLHLALGGSTAGGDSTP